MIDPAGTVSSCCFVWVPRVNPACVRAAVASSRVLPARSVGTVTNVLPSDTVIVTAFFSSSDFPSTGSWAMTSPFFLPSMRPSIRRTCQCFA